MNSRVVKLNRTIKKIKVPGVSEIKLAAVREIAKNVKQELIAEPEQEPVPQLIHLTEEELNNRLQSARQQGFDAGCLEQKDELIKEFQDRFNLLEKIGEEINNRKTEVLKAGEKIVVKLALAIARKILKHEASVNPELVLNVIKAALKKVSAIEKNIVVRLNSSDREILALNLTELVDQSTHLKDIRLQADDRIGKGGCLVESDFSTIDATLETQLQAIEQTLFAELDDQGNCI